MAEKNDVCIGLFGTCDNSKWRDAFMKDYDMRDVDYFNPDAGDDWHPGMIADENKHLREDQIILFPVLGESLGFGSLGEIGFSINNVIRNIANGKDQRLIALIDDECTDDRKDVAARSQSTKARKLVKSKLLEVNHPSVYVVETLEEMLIVSNFVTNVIKDENKNRKQYCG